jgi:hypothetical protein
MAIIGESNAKHAAALFAVAVLHCFHCLLAKRSGPTAAARRFE